MNDKYVICKQCPKFDNKLKTKKTKYNKTNEF